AVAAPRGFWARMRARLRGGPPQPAPVADPTPVAEPRTEAASSPPARPTPRTVGDERSALNEALDSLGAAHHRPYSRA
ncbi:MAG TPA: hypothetical protein VLQ79_07350, partial [Myxococcaceae bacterium]|nr:hypothetical protein [Myxococcaceae bacterium]